MVLLLVMSAAITSASISQVLSLVTLSGSSISSDRFSEHPTENRATHHNSPTSVSINVHRLTGFLPVYILNKFRGNHLNKY